MCVRRAIFAVLCCLVIAPLAWGQGFQWPTETKNVQALPKDTVGPKLRQTMLDFVNGLGVRCSHCHVGEGPDLSKYDFAADDKPEKKAARVMIKMVRAINDTHLPGLAVEEGHARREVKCVTCHHGQGEPPEPLDEVLAASVAKDGADAAVTRYRELRETYYGGFAYDFGPQSLVALAPRLAQQGQSAEAVRFLELNAEVHPQSPSTYMMLARIHGDAGEREKAIQALERALAVAPEDQKPAIQRNLERLRTPQP